MKDKKLSPKDYWKRKYYKADEKLFEVREKLKDEIIIDFPKFDTWVDMCNLVDRVFKEVIGEKNEKKTT